MNSYYTNKCSPIRRVLLVDTTLRDGNQSAYGTMFDREKIAIAKQLEKMGVDVIEAGFAVSNGNAAVMEEISRIVKRPCLSGLARGKEQDIYETYRALKNYENRMVHIFLPTSDIQVKAKLKKTEHELIKMAESSVRFARKYFPEVEFTAEDSARSDEDFLKRIYGEAINAGATVVNIADTVGFAEFYSFGELVKNMKDYSKSINPDVRVGVHCHNDLGLATANSLAGIANGAEQVEVTINGLGERAGNCSLEQIVLFSLVKRPFGDSKKMQRPFYTGIDPKQLYPASKKVTRVTGIRNDMAPGVGKTAFAHKSGIHQHAVSNDRESYEVIDPALLGRESEIIIGPHSGYHGMIEKSSQLGFEMDEERARRAIDIVSDMVEKELKKRFTDKDLQAIFLQLGL